MILISVYILDLHTTNNTQTPNISISYVIQYDPNHIGHEDQGYSRINMKVIA